MYIIVRKAREMHKDTLLHIVVNLEREKKLAIKSFDTLYKGKAGGGVL